MGFRKHPVKERIINILQGNKRGFRVSYILILVGLGFGLMVTTQMSVIGLEIKTEVGETGTQNYLGAIWSKNGKKLDQQMNEKLISDNTTKEEPIVQNIVFEPRFPVDNPYVTKKISLEEADYHDGVDFRLELEDKVYVIEDGIVDRVESVDEGFNLIVVHSHGYTSIYRTLKEISVAEGTQLQKGDELGIIGFTGTGPHLHLSLFYEERAIDNNTYHSE